MPRFLKGLHDFRIFLQKKAVFYIHSRQKSESQEFDLKKLNFKQIIFIMSSIYSGDVCTDYDNGGTVVVTSVDNCSGTATVYDVADGPGDTYTVDIDALGNS